jgi:hypothetical protein
VPVDDQGLTVVERLPGGATTDFGAPGVAAKWESGEIEGRELKRLLSILDACWSAFDRTLAKAEGATLRTGPRGGGRTVEKISSHVLDAEAAYMHKIGAAPPRAAGAAEERAALVEGLTRAAANAVPGTGPRGGKMWAPRYFVRRTAWHVLDHAWEIEDRLEA